MPLALALEMQDAIDNEMHSKISKIPNSKISINSA